MNFLELKIPRSGEKVIIDADNGATVVSLKLGERSREIMANDSDEEYSRNPLFRGRFLFPFNDRIPEGRYGFNGKEYQLPVNCKEDGSAIHGFMYNKKVRSRNISDSQVSVSWSTGEYGLSGYPFNMYLMMNFTLEEGKLIIDFTVKNQGSRTAPFALGWHCYFLTDPGALLYADFPCFFKTDSSFLPIGDCIPVKGTEFDFSSGSPLDGKILDHTFRFPEVPEDRRVILKNNDYSVKIYQRNFAYTQLFNPPEGGSTAIEPITSKPNSFNSPDVLTLDPGKVYTASVVIES